MVKRMLLVSRTERQASLVITTVLPTVSRKVISATFPVGVVRSYRFDVCTTTDCQVYQGANQASALTDRAVEETAGVRAFPPPPSGTTPRLLAPEQSN